MKVRPPITGLILAGGRGLRMGEQDKGLLPFRGQSMVQWVAQRLRPQVHEILISANRNLEAYAALGDRVIADVVPGFAGPLAGLHAAMTVASHAWILAVPCDSPLLPADLAARLIDALQRENAALAVARAADRRHPVFCLCPTALRPSLESYLAGGGRKMGDWLARHACAEADFSDEAECLANVNTLDDLSALEQT
ncbi:MAG: molybdenum cofactor guanylyltransferase [Betaproteobacteria bacterium]|nr:molybdenum cofactor guanylyltransferase [Betaproteobacteria bacterium]